MNIWIVDLRDLAPTRLFRCSCTPGQRCDYHATDWPLLLSVVLEEFRAKFGDGPVDLAMAEQTLWPRIERRWGGRCRHRERQFALSLFQDPMLASSVQWTNGQQRCQAAMDAGCHQSLFCG